MNFRLIRISIVTDDYVKSVALYRDTFGLRMRPPCNPIAMFPLDNEGKVLFEVCHRMASKDLVEYDFLDASVSGLVMTLNFENHEQRDKFLFTVSSSEDISVIEKSRSGSPILRDFNGVIWTLV